MSYGQPTAATRHPMSDEAAEEALNFLNDNANKAGLAKAQMIYMENYRKTVLARLKRASTEKTDAGRDTEARAHKDYEEICVAQYQAIVEYEQLFWKRTAAEATLEAWRTRSANQRGAGKMQ